MAPTTRAGARRAALLVEESMTGGPSDACSRTNEDVGRARRKRRRPLDAFSYAYEDDNMALLTIFVAAVLDFVINMFAYEEADPDADLLEKALHCLKAMKPWIDHELGPENVICEEVLDLFEEDLDLYHDLSSAHETSASKGRKFRSLMALPKDMRMEWLLIHTRELWSKGSALSSM